MTELNDVNIRHIKLSTGDELIAIVLSDEEIGQEESKPIGSNLLVVQRPMKIHTVEKDRVVSFLFYEWQPLSNDDICYINPMHVVSHVECSNDVKGQYINVCVNSDETYEHEPHQQQQFDYSDFESDLDSDLDLNLIPTPSKTYH